MAKPFVLLIRNPRFWGGERDKALTSTTEKGLERVIEVVKCECPQGSSVLLLCETDMLSEEAEKFLRRRIEDPMVEFGRISPWGGLPQDHDLGAFDVVCWVVHDYMIEEIRDSLPGLVPIFLNEGGEK